MSDANTQSYVFAPPETVTVPVSDRGLFPVRRIFCIGRNYADHVREMGGDPKADPPVFFSKPADAVVPNSSMIWSIGEIIMTLSTLYKLRAGDLVLTGTPEGVSPLVPGDLIAVRIDPLPPLEFTIGS